MARRRKKQNQILAISLGLGALLLLTVIAVNSPWAIVSIAFIIILICGAGVGIATLWGTVEKETRRVEKTKRFASVRSPVQMAFLTPTDFERYVAMLYENLGYESTVTKQSGDGGIDIVLKNKDITAAIQVKRYTKGNVGRPEVQRLVGASLNKFNRMIFVTTSNYSNEAREYGLQHNVELIDGDGLARMAERVFGPDYIHKALSFSIMQRK
jgi:restriction system protein